MSRVAWINVVGYETVQYEGFGEFKIGAASDMIRWRAKSFLTKEPTTLEWLQSLEKDAWLIDVGANIGIYTIPSALYHVSKVIAVEPEIKNYLELVRNIEMNGLDADKVEALPLAVSTEFANSSTKIYLTKDEPGMSCHQVGRNQNYRLELLNQQRVSRSVYCVSLADLINSLSIEANIPLHLKVDVDGIEEDVCQSLFSYGAINRLSSIQVELNPSISSHKSLIAKFHSHGFSYLVSQISRAVRKSGDFAGFAEYVFRRRIKYSLYDSMDSEQRFVYTRTTAEDAKDSSRHVIGFNLPVQNLKLKYLPKPSIEQMCHLPPAFKLKDAMHPDIQYYALNAVFKSIKSSNSFEFNALADSYVKPEDKRLAIDCVALKETSPHYFEYLLRLVSSRDYFSHLFSGVDSALQHILGYTADERLNKSSKKKFLVARLRHFVDISGFYLTKHHDSYDTLLAYIHPLAINSTTTSLFVESPVSVSNLDLHRTTFPYQAQFNSNATYSDLDRKGRVLSKVMKEKACKIQSYNVTKLDLSVGEAIILPNMLCKDLLCANNRLGLTTKSTGHGVFPPVQEMHRPILLIDYLVWDSDRFKSDSALVIRGSELLANLGYVENVI